MPEKLNEMSMEMPEEDGGKREDWRERVREEEASEREREKEGG